MHDIRHVPFNEESLTRQRLIRVALDEEEADLVLEGATMLNVQTLTWKKDWDIVISGQRIAWVGPSGQWSGKARNRISISGLWAVPGFGEAHKHIESTMLSPGGVIEASHFAIRAPAGRDTATAAIMEPFKLEPDLVTATLPVENGLVQRDLAQGITKVALLDRYSGRIRVSKMFWKNVGMKTPESAMSCSIVHDNHNAWVTGSSDEAMALAVNTMAAIDGGYVLVREGKIVATIRLEIGGLMTARPAEAFAQDLNQMHREMEQIDWIYEGDFRLSEFLGVRQITEALNYAFLTCSPFRWVLVPPTDTVPDGLLNVRTGETHAVVW